MSELFVVIGQIALNVLAAQLGGRPVEISAAALEIISAAKRAYEAETGMPLDVEKIRPYQPIA